ncbi:hypothetical protein ACB092_12G057600 [Castanea dentata]
MLLVHLSPALGFISGAGVGDANNIRCLEGERQALLEFKKGLVDDSGSLSSWGRKKNCCDWEGIHCSNQASHVLELKLAYYGLQGMIISPSLLELPYLTLLDLSGNDFNGSHNWLVVVSGIPTFLGGICTLIKLDLSENNLNVKLVDVINNLSGCAKDSLEILDLSSNQLAGSLRNFAIFPRLKEIYLGSNNINGTVPRSIGNLTKLEHLDISSNSFRGVISEDHFSNLSKLQFLFLFNNSLALEVSLNRILPFQLDKLHLSSCKLGPRFPKWIRTQRKVSFLRISHTNISDTIPADWFADLPHTLEFLDLSSSQMHGRLPKVSTKRLNGLAIILSDNRIKGPLPLFSTNLTILNLSKNQFSGSISSICKINGRSLTYLDLSDNLLSGQLPHCFMHWDFPPFPNQQANRNVRSRSNASHLRKLLILNLAGNNFTGEIPSSFGSLSQLHTLNLRNNSFSGELPLPLKNCGLLKFVDLGNNKFSGSVPAWIGEGLPQLNILILRSNKFGGSIPLNLCWLKYLRILDLSVNNISGTIPQCFNNFTAMAQKGDLFSGIIGSNYTDSYVYDYDDTEEFINDATVIMKGRELEYGKYLGLLKIINLASNKLTGKVPSEISSLLELVVLNISRNKLIGEIPQMIGQLKQLQSLDMSRNQFSNEIPSSMSELHFLSDLDLSYNNFSGKIPSGTQLQSFDAVDFTGNWALCGPPLPNKCPGEETPDQSDQPTDHDGNEDNDKDGDEFEKWFFAAAGFGFFIGFWGICGPLLLKSSWRGAYFLFLDNMKDWLYATKLAMCMKRLRWKFKNQG